MRLVTRFTAFSLIMLLMFTAGLPACAAWTAVVNSIPTILNIIGQSQTVLRVIDLAFDEFGNAQIVPKETVVTFRHLLADCYVALDAAQHLIAGAGSLSQEQTDEAFASFRRSYAALTDFLRRVGVMRPNGTITPTAGRMITIRSPMVIEDWQRRHPGMSLNQ